METDLLTDMLLDLIEEFVPMPTRITPRLAATLKDKVPGIEPLMVGHIVSIHDSGDFGGLMCVVELETAVKKSVVVTSITHLAFDRRHPLAREIATYQKRRIKKLKKEGFGLRMVSGQFESADEQA